MISSSSNPIDCLHSQEKDDHLADYMSVLFAGFVPGFVPGVRWSTCDSTLTTR